MTQKAVVEQFYHRLWNQGDKRYIETIFHPHFTFRGSLGPVLEGHDQFADYVDNVLGALPGFVCEILEMTEQENRVVARMRFSGHHLGVFMDYPPTGAHVEWLGSAHFTFQGALVADLWVLGDVHGLLAQLKANSA
ncbi:MAG: ester cyclase [Hyphomicrobiales bacterium]